jgi:hypothetical protein
MHAIDCATCRLPTPSYDIVNCGSMDGGYRSLCSRCFNEAAADLLGLIDFEHVDLEPVRMTDARGIEREFHFRPWLGGAGLAIEAFELRKGVPSGYQFQVIGEPEEDPLALLGTLIARMRRALARIHLDDTHLGPQVNDGMTVRAMVTSDPHQQERVPMVIIDGREFTWEAFGRMVAAFEGWQFKLEFRDRSDEV